MKTQLTRGHVREHVREHAGDQPNHHLPAPTPISEWPEKTQHTHALRPASQVMTLERLGSFHPSRLSFMRILMRRLKAEHWRFSRPRFALDPRGVGHAVYTLTGPQRAYSLVVFAHDLPAHKRSDRVIADAWDATFALFDGIPDEQDINRLQAHVPLQEGARLKATELTLSRANRSVRLWTHCVDRLSAGQQPDVEQLDRIGYLMRTTAVYGSGKFGACDREQIADRPELAAPFQAEMMTVYLIRAFARDWVEHCAHARSPHAVNMDESLAETLGIGNSTGLGMAPFLINHPALISRWVEMRETALARVLALPQITAVAREQVSDLINRSLHEFRDWVTDDARMMERIIQLRADLTLAQKQLPLVHDWRAFYRWTETALGTEAQECLVSLLLEPYPEQVDELAEQMSVDESPGLIPGCWSLPRVAEHIRRHYRWALEVPWHDAATQARLWYVSEEKLEPRLAERQDEPLEAYEQPLGPARDMAAFYHAIDGRSETLARFLLRHPEHRGAARRLFLQDVSPYAEIRGNTVGAELVPVDLLRCKLSYFGASRFDPRSDRWLRICMFRHAPYPSRLQHTADAWHLPER